MNEPTDSNPHRPPRLFIALTQLVTGLALALRDVLDPLARAVNEADAQRLRAAARWRAEQLDAQIAPRLTPAALVLAHERWGAREM